MKIKITADSTCDLGPQLLAEHSIALVPLYVNIGDRCLRDTVDATPDDIYAHVEAGGGMSSTAAPNLADYADIFSAYAGDYDAIIHISLSSELSSSFQNARAAAGEFDNVYVVDSRNLSTGHGLLVMRAVQLAQSGVDAAAIAAELEQAVDKVDASFILTQLEYLRRGGRCSSVAALGANLLKLKPCIEVKGGKMGVNKKYRGDFAKCVDQYVRDRLADMDTVDPSLLFITHSGVPEEAIDAARRAAQACGGFDKIVVTRAGCTISSHCGPGTLGVLFMRK